MATYLIGDVQGCYEELSALLRECSFDVTRDHAVFLGDLVNRGPQSLQVLQYVRSMGKNCTVLLGNHDLHLLAVANGIRHSGKSDTFDDVLQSPEREALLSWLQHQRMAHYLPLQNILCVHAGVLPQWTLRDTLTYALELEAALQAHSYVQFLSSMYGNEPNAWHDDLQGVSRLRVIVNALTRLRFCSELGEDGKSGGVMEFNTKEAAAAAPVGYVAWFDVQHRATRDTRVAFGHWSTLTLRVDQHIAALDTGCVWGGALTALRLAEPLLGIDEKVFQVKCKGYQAPG